MGGRKQKKKIRGTMTCHVRLSLDTHLRDLDYHMRGDPVDLWVEILRLVLDRGTR
jgi:hypothetical protein